MVRSPFLCIHSFTSPFPFLVRVLSFPPPIVLDFSTFTFSFLLSRKCCGLFIVAFNSSSLFAIKERYWLGHHSFESLSPNSFLRSLLSLHLSIYSSCFFFSSSIVLDFPTFKFNFVLSGKCCGLFIVAFNSSSLFAIKERLWLGHRSSASLFPNKTFL